MQATVQDDNTIKLELLGKTGYALQLYFALGNARFLS